MRLEDREAERREEETPKPLKPHDGARLYARNACQN